MYVIIGDDVGFYSEGMYCKFLDMKDGIWNKCEWVKINKATIFTSLKNAKKAITQAKDWGKYCKVSVIKIHPLNAKKIT